MGSSASVDPRDLKAFVKKWGVKWQEFTDMQKNAANTMNFLADEQGTPLAREQAEGLSLIYDSYHKVINNVTEDLFTAISKEAQNLAAVSGISLD